MRSESLVRFDEDCGEFDSACSGRSTSRTTTSRVGLKFPETGCAPLASRRAGEWEKFEPRPVRITATRFVCFDPAWETDRYFTLTPGEFIQGLLARINLNTRVYVVTVAPPVEYAEFQRWPRVVRAGRKRE